jgi:protein-arginine deiminase
MSSTTYSWPWTALAALGLAAGCNSAASTPTSALLADTNRDGVVDANDAAGKSDWNAAGGALFLANLDDDDGDGMADASDQVVNGPDDEKDLARITLAPWPGASSSAVATLTVEDSLAAAAVHLFRHDGTTWTILTSPATLSKTDLASGLEFGIEATGFSTSTDPASWNGYAVVHLIITDGAKSLVDDQVKLRVAPYVMVNNLSSLAQVWDAPLGDTGSDDFTSGIMSLATAGAATEQEAMFSDPNSLDQWAEDWWQIGHTWMPGPNGTTQGMVVPQRSAQPDRPAGAFAATQLGKDVGFIWPHTNSPNGQSNPAAYSLDSFGDHDTIPPYTKGTDTYPLGRIFIGGNATVHIDSTVRAFYDAQLVQPVFQVDTTFLDVGHVDEIFSFVPAATPRGWKLLVASPTLARTMLQAWSTAGNGATQLFVGKSWYDDNGNPTPAAVTIDALLADTDIMAANEMAQNGIDDALAALKTEVGLGDDEVVEIPFLFERLMDGGYKVTAHMVGTVNMRVLNGQLGIPTPHGPQIGGMDGLEQDLQTRLGSSMNALGANGMGLPIIFVEDWDDYHALEGEVHCGSNVAAMPMTNIAWWEAGR